VNAIVAVLGKAESAALVQAASICIRNMISICQSRMHWRIVHFAVVVLFSNFARVCLFLFSQSR
jgi:hypothetical protein